MAIRRITRVSRSSRQSGDVSPKSVFAHSTGVAGTPLRVCVQFVRQNHREWEIAAPCAETRRSNFNNNLRQLYMGVLLIYCLLFFDEKVKTIIFFHKYNKKIAFFSRNFLIYIQIASYNQLLKIIS